MHNTPLSPWYAVRHEDDWLVAKNHEVKSSGFTSYSDSDFRKLAYQYAVDSPMSGGSRNFLLTTSRRVFDVFKEGHEEFYRGRVHEEVMRIVLKEFLRRQYHAGNIDTYDFIERKDDEIVLRSENYSLFLPQRYNAVISSDIVKSERDGLMEYSFSGQKGLIVCEAKSGGLDYFSMSGIERKRKIVARVINPYKELFPGHTIDLLLMAHADYLFEDTSRFKANSLKPGLRKLADLLSENDIGLIPWSYTESRDAMNKIGDDIRSLHQATHMDTAKIERLQKGFCDMKTVVVGDYLINARQMRIMQILKRRNGLYDIIYEAENPHTLKVSFSS